MVKVLSLFDGISCGMVAFERAGIPVEEYHACEIDKYAIQISQKNYPQIVRHGSVIDYHPDRDFDYIIAGSPCQGFSSSGKGLAFDDPRSALYFEFERILKECQARNPDIKILLENVKMKQCHLQTISDRLAINTVNNSSKLCFDAGTTIVETGKGKRRLTPLECERLQTLPDNYTEGVSDRQRYFMIGNGWTIDVIAHILRGSK